VAVGSGATEDVGAVEEVGMAAAEVGVAAVDGGDSAASLALGVSLLQAASATMAANPVARFRMLRVVLTVVPF